MFSQVSVSHSVHRGVGATGTRPFLGVGMPDPMFLHESGFAWYEVHSGGSSYIWSQRSLLGVGISKWWGWMMGDGHV